MHTAKSNIWGDHSHRDALITQAYTSANRGKGAIKTLQEQLGANHNRIYRRAVTLGLITEQTKRQPEWTPPELEILEDHAHKHPITIAKFLQCKGYPRRTPAAIKIKMNKIGLKLTETSIDAGIYSCNEASKLMGVANHVISKYITTGMLAAKRDPIRQNNQLQITNKALKHMLVNYTASIDFKKIDKYWLVEILTGGTGEKTL